MMQIKICSILVQDLDKLLYLFRSSSSNWSKTWTINHSRDDTYALTKIITAILDTGSQAKEFTMTKAKFFQEKESREVIGIRKS